MNLIADFRQWRQKGKEVDRGELDLKGQHLLFRGVYHVSRFTQITFREFLEDQLPLKSMALTFATLLTFVPLMVIAFSIFKMLGGGDWFVETMRPILIENLAPGTGENVAAKVQELVMGSGLSTLSGLGLILLIFAVYSIFAGVETVINGIWGTRSPAGSLQRVPMYWGLLTIVPILVVGSVALTTYLQALPVVSQTIERVRFSDAVMNRGLTVIMMITAMFLLYRFVPSTRVRTYAALIGAVAAGMCHEMVKIGFIIYTSEMVQVDVLYGSLAAIPLLLIWVNLSWIVVLGGVEVSYVVQHYNNLCGKPKHLKLSHSQEAAVAYIMLYDATKAFYGERKNLIIEDWAIERSVPPAIAEEMANKLQKSGFVERGGRDYSRLLLANSPRSITVRDLENVLTFERNKQWKWPESSNWNWLHDWLKTRSEAAYEAAKCEKLSDIVDHIDQTATHQSK